MNTDEIIISSIYHHEHANLVRCSSKIKSMARTRRRRLQRHGRAATQTTLFSTPSSRTKKIFSAFFFGVQWGVTVTATATSERARDRGTDHYCHDKRRRGRAGKTHCEVTLSTRAAPCSGPALRKRRSARTLCAPQARPAHTRQRATGSRALPACMLCVVVLCHQRHAVCARCSSLWPRPEEEA